MSLSRGRIVLIGCLAAVGVVVVVALVAWFLLAQWLHAPSPPLDGPRLADHDTAAYLDVVLRRDDPVARALVRDLLVASRDTSDLPREVPGWLRGVIQRAGSRPPTDKELDPFLPLRLVATIAGDSPDTFGPPLIAINAEGAGRAFRFVDTMVSLAARRDTDLRRVDHQGTSIYRIPLESSQVWFAVAGGDLLASQDDATVRRGLDRLRPGAGPGPDWIQAALAGMPPDAVFRIVTAENRPASLGSLIPEGSAEWRAVIEPALESAGALSLWARFPDPETLRGEVRLGNRAAGPGDSSFEVTLPMADGPLRIRIEPQAAGGAWDIEVRGVGSGLQSLLRRLRKSLPEGLLLTGR